MKARESSRSWFAIAAIAAIYLLLCTWTRPLLPDGDGLALASRAIYSDYLMGMVPKHPLAAALLRVIYQLMHALGLETRTLGAFTLVSQLSSVGTFLLLALSIYPRFIESRLVSATAALGTVLSFGILSRSVAIEVYAPALFLDVAVVAYCLSARFETRIEPIVAGCMLAGAVGFHVTNVLIIPFIVGIVVARSSKERRRHALALSLAAFACCLALLAVLLWVGRGGARWPIEFAAILPQRDPQPSMGIATRLARTAYGFCRSLAFLPYVKDLTIAHALLYFVSALGLLLALAGVARRGFWKRIKGAPPLVAIPLLLAIPFVLMGCLYYPSDPERWLFLTPLVWFFVALAFDTYDPQPASRLTRGRVQASLVGVVLLLGLYNLVVGLRPDARRNRDLAGLLELARIATPQDLVISPASVTAKIYEFCLPAPIAAENLSLMTLSETYPSAPESLQKDLSGRVESALGSGRNVFVFNLFDEGHEAERGYPWAHMSPGYAPDTFLEPLARFHPQKVVQPGPDLRGTFQLKLAPGS